jgi:hypothetical protein
LQVETLFAMKRDGNLCLVDVDVANWQHFITCIIKYVPNTCVIVCLLHNLRNNENYTTLKSRLRMSMTSFIPSTVSWWNNLDLTVRNSSNISCFKSRIKENTGKFPEYHGEGSRKISILHARLRHQCSSLISDLYRINIINDPKCQCGAPYENSIHYLMECPLYQTERYCLFRNLTETHKNIETLLFGNDEINMNKHSIIFQ